MVAEIKVPKYKSFIIVLVNHIIVEKRGRNQITEQLHTAAIR